MFLQIGSISGCILTMTTREVSIGKFFSCLFNCVSYFIVLVVGILFPKQILLNILEMNCKYLHSQFCHALGLIQLVLCLVFSFFAEKIRRLLFLYKQCLIQIFICTGIVSLTTIFGVVRQLHYFTIGSVSIYNAFSSFVFELHDRSKDRMSR